MFYSSSIHQQVQPPPLAPRHSHFQDYLKAGPSDSFGVAQKEPDRKK
jgi:hypothetical protein